MLDVTWYITLSLPANECSFPCSVIYYWEVNSLNTSFRKTTELLQWCSTEIVDEQKVIGCHPMAWIYARLDCPSKCCCRARNAVGIAWAIPEYAGHQQHSRCKGLSLSSVLMKVVTAPYGFRWLTQRFCPLFVPGFFYSKRSRWSNLWHITSWAAGGAYLQLVLYWWCFFL